MLFFYKMKYYSVVFYRDKINMLFLFKNIIYYPNMNKKLTFFYYIIISKRNNILCNQDLFFLEFTTNTIFSVNNPGALDLSCGFTGDFLPFSVTFVLAFICTFFFAIA